MPLMEAFQNLFESNNPVFQGGIGLAVLAGGAQLLRSGSGFGLMMLKRHFLVTLEVTSKDRAYPWVLQWLSAQGKRTQHVSVETSLKPVTTARGGARTIFGLLPGPGQHFLNYKGTFMSVQRFREQQMVDLNTGKPWEKVQFMAFGTDTSPFEDILDEAFQMASAKEEGKTIVYTNWGSEWRPFGNPRNRRPLSSVILDKDIAERILADVITWRHSAELYLNRGVPYRRGYLLHGPPGSGKSSFIMALAGHLDHNICVLNLAERGLTDDRLALALSSVPPQSIVLLEDIDAAFPKRSRGPGPQGGAGGAGAGSSRFGGAGSGSGSGMHSSDVTFSGLLNVLDGVASSEDRLVFMTTNHMEQLDPALIRPGRVDLVEYIGNASPHQIREMFAKFFPSQPSSDVTQALDAIVAKFVDTVAASGVAVSMAALQGHLLMFKDDPEGALLAVHMLLGARSEGVTPPSAPRSGTGSSSGSGSGSGSSDIGEGSAGGNEEVGEEEEEEVRRAARARALQRAKRGPLTVAEVDRMPFNPQPGWDQDIK